MNKKLPVNKNTPWTAARAARPDFASSFIVHLTMVSKNTKTGPIPVSTSPSVTCPDACPFKDGSCYAIAGMYLRMHWKKVDAGVRGMPWSEFLGAVRNFKQNTFWRHDQAGDLPGENDKIEPSMLADLATANEGKRGFTYTHKPVLTGQHAKGNLRAIRSANRAGFVVNLSANSIQHADELATLGLPVAAVVPQSSPDRFTTPAGNKVVICPAQRVAGLSCDKCRLCAKGDRGFIIGFKPHGTGARKVEAITSAV